VKSKDKSMLIVFFDFKGIVHKKNRPLQIRKPISHTSVTFYGDCMNMCASFAPKFGDKRTGCCMTITLSHTSVLTREFFTKNNMTVIHHPPYLSLFPLLKIKLKGLHFDTIKVVETESQAVLNTLTEHDFQGLFKKWQKRCK
jgi:hypothetical protein